MPAASPQTVLKLLPKARIEFLGRQLGSLVPATLTKDEQVQRLLAADTVRLVSLLPLLSREELRSACRAHGLEASERARRPLMVRLLGDDDATLDDDSASTAAGRSTADGVPVVGDIVRARHRQYLVEQVAPPCEPGQHTRVRLVCIDDDASGQAMELLWERELGARVIEPTEHGLGDIDRLDPPRHFAAYLHALKWNCVTATDPKLFQSPFRAGIQIKNHQLVPLKKALALPRANLFIADDVGLGKTIEAGLIAQELLLRQRINQILIVCPASVALQWQGEMEQRFGLRFELYNRNFVARRRRERGFAVNPWSTHPRFIISYQTLRRPEYREPLLRHLDGRAPKSLLILDEAHTAAPASATKYAVDSHITRVIRDLAPLYEHRLFLSATPHNGHSNSFSALLEILDPQRFTRGVKVSGPKALGEVMVRRLKQDLALLGTEDIRDRHVVQISLSHQGDGWQQQRSITPASTGKATDEPVQSIGAGTAAELELATMLRKYASVVGVRKKRSKLVLINLQKRLLSSIEAFARTLRVHADSLGVATVSDSAASAPLPPVDDSEVGLSDEESEAAALAHTARASRALEANAEAKRVLDDMLLLADRSRREASPKVLALLAWMRVHQCPAVAVGGAASDAAAKARAWSGTRVIIFTEYGDTKRYLRELLSTAIAGTDLAEQRIAEFHGGMSDEQREEVQRAFNGPPDEYPVRILLCTDAAREGINLQGHCANLFHYDIPWNPARMEQRNGRIDRLLQTEDPHCHYFFYPQRKEDAVLKAVVDKVARIGKELGSLADVVSEQIGALLEKSGLQDETGAAVERAGLDDSHIQAALFECEKTRDEVQQKRESDEAGRLLDKSREFIGFREEHLHDALNVGLEMLGAEALAKVESADDLVAYALPTLSDAWQRTLDTLRPAKPRDQEFWQWRKTPPLPIVFHPPATMRHDVRQLHLSHPFVQRILSRFLSQGFSAHDLSRVTVVRNPEASVARVIAFGRLSLFGPGAVRLHEQLVPVAAQWLESKGDGHLRPFAEAADKRALDNLENIFAQAAGRGVPAAVEKKLIASASADFATLWQHIEHEADDAAQKSEQALIERADSESAALAAILRAQKVAIEAELDQKQMAFDFGEKEKEQARQWQEDRKHMQVRLGQLEREIKEEPQEIKDSYQLTLRRLEPVGLVYLWPSTR